MNLSNFINFLLTSEDSFSPYEQTLKSGVRLHHTKKGILEFTPATAKTPKKSFVFSCGIHGNETAPIEIINDLVKDLDNGKLKLAYPVLIIFGHVEAMKKAKRFNFDNLNRMFNDNYKNFPEDHLEAKLAKDIQFSINDFFSKYPESEKIHYDLHTAIKPSAYKRFAIYPYMHGRDYSSEQIEVMTAMGIEAILLSNGPSTTLSYHSSYNHHAHSFTLELGKVEKFGQNIRSHFVKAESVLRSLVSGESLNSSKNVPVLFKVKKELIRHDEDYNFYIADDIANFTSFPKGTTLAEDKVEKYITTEDDERIVFPKGDVKVGQRSGLVVIPTLL